MHTLYMDLGGINTHIGLATHLTFYDRRVSGASYSFGNFTALLEKSWGVLRLLWLEIYLSISGYSGTHKGRFPTK